MLSIIAVSLLATGFVYDKAKFGIGEENDPITGTRFEEQKFIVAGAVNGALSSMVVLYQYLSRPHMQVYPNPLLIRQTLADLFMATVTVALYLPHNTGLLGDLKNALIYVVGFVVLVVLVRLREWTWLAGSIPAYGLLVGLNRMELGSSDFIPKSCLVPSVMFTGKPTHNPATFSPG